MPLPVYTAPPVSPQMKKAKRMNLFAILLVCAAAGFVLYLQKGQVEINQAKSLLPLYNAVVAQEFTVARFDGQKLYACTQDLKTLLGEIPISLPYDKAFDSIRCLLKRGGDNVFFVMGGGGNDFWGYVFSDAKMVSMDGLKTLRPLSGIENAYYFSSKR